MKTSKPQNFSKLLVSNFIALGFFTSAHSSAQGQIPADPAVDNLRSMQRLSLQTKGDLPTVAQEKAVLAGMLTASEFLQSQKNNPELSRRLSAFW